MARPVRGIEDVNAAFKKVSDDIREQKGPILKQIAEPVRRDALVLAATTIERITLPWSRMRIGVTKRAVYVAPKKRSTRNPFLKRPEFADLLKKRAMEPALERNRERVTADLDKFLTAVTRAF